MNKNLHVRPAVGQAEKHLMRRMIYIFEFRVEHILIFRKKNLFWVGNSMQKSDQEGFK